MKPSKGSSSKKVENILARTEQEEILEIERNKAILTENKMKAKAEKAAQKLDSKQSNLYYGNRTDRNHGHQPKGSQARESSPGTLHYGR